MTFAKREQLFQQPKGLSAQFLLYPEKWCPVMNLKALNVHVVALHFKMKSIRSVKGMIQKDDWLTKLDLKDAYLTVPVLPCHQKYLRFCWQDQMWQFVVLPFGLNNAPFIFTKLMKPVVATVRKLGIQVILYLDNMLIMANSLSMTNSLPALKLTTMLRATRHLAEKMQVSLREISQILGTMVATHPAILPAPLHHRHLERTKAEASSYNSQPLQLTHWHLIIESDVSKQGLGAS